MQYHANRPHLLLIHLIKNFHHFPQNTPYLDRRKRGGLRDRLARFSVSPGIVAASTIQLHFSFVDFSFVELL